MINCIPVGVAVNLGIVGTAADYAAPGIPGTASVR